VCATNFPCVFPHTEAQTHRYLFPPNSGGVSVGYMYICLYMAVCHVRVTVCLCDICICVWQGVCMSVWRCVVSVWCCVNTEICLVYVSVFHLDICVCGSVSVQHMHICPCICV